MKVMKSVLKDFAKMNKLMLQQFHQTVNDENLKGKKTEHGKSTKAGTDTSLEDSSVNFLWLLLVFFISFSNGSGLGP